MRRALLMSLAAAALHAGPADAGPRCCGCAAVRYAAPAYSVVATPARLVPYTVPVIYAPAGTSPCLVHAVAEAFPPPSARIMFDLRTGRLTFTDPW